MKLRTARHLMVALIATAGLAALSFQAAVYAVDQNDRGATVPNAIGSWFGRAVPVQGETLCDPGPGCLVPPEVMMVFTVNADGTFIAIDAGRVPAHGQWKRNGPRSIRAAFTLMQVGSTGFIGSFKNLFEARLVNPDEMQGTIEAHLYAYVNQSTGAVIVDSDGFPTPNPLEPASLCSDTPGCTDVGKFSFIVRRVKIQ